MIAVVVVRDGVLPQGADEAAAECGGRVLLAGSGTVMAAEALATSLAGQVYLLELAATGFQPAHFAAAIASHLAGEPHVVLPASADGRDLAPRLAALLRRPLHAGAIAVTPSRVDLARNGGTELHRATPAPEFLATLLPGVRGVTPCPGAEHTVEVLAPLPAAAAPAAGGPTDPTVVAVLPPDPATIDLSEAPRIVAAGAGLDGPERIPQLTAVGRAIGASMGATRVVTDRGWVPHARQIGTTGVVVDPSLYLAFGISGAVQHTSGLGTPAHTISVNTDAHCPMMQMADLAVVADANETLDHLERLLGRPAEGDAGTMQEGVA